MRTHLLAWAVEKLESSLLGIVIVLAITQLSGQSAESLYIRRGNLRLGLIVGFIAFAVMTATVIPVAEIFFKGENLSWARILPWTPWVLIFVLANASNEELIFRGLLIGKMEPFLGKFAHEHCHDHSVCVVTCSHRLLNRSIRFSRAANPACFAGMVLADAKVE